MRMRETKNDIKTLVIVVLVLIIILGGGYFWYQLSDKQQADKKQPDPETAQQDVATMPQDPKGPDKQVPKQYEGQGDEDQSNVNSDQITGVINSKEVADGKFSLRLTINQLLGSGTCTLTMTNQKTVTKTAEIVQNPSSSSCKGFDVPVSELGPGQWSIKINIKSGDKTGVIKDSFNIQS